MSFNGPPRQEHLLARVRRWISDFAGAFFWPLNNIEQPDAERPENGIINDPPLPPQRDVEHSDGDGILERPSSRRGEEREDAVNHIDDQNIRAPSPSFQQLPPPNVGMDLPVYYHLPHAVPYAPPFPFPYVYPYGLVNALPHAFPYANPFAFAYVPPYAPPYVPPYVPAYVDPFAFGYAPLFAPLYAAPYVPQYGVLHAFPFLNADPHVPERLIARNPQERPEQDPGIDAIGVDEENENDIPELEVFGLGHPETIGPLSTEECLGILSSDNSSLEEDVIVPSTSGFSSFIRRRIESDEGEPSAKRPRWPDETDSD